MKDLRKYIEDTIIGKHEGGYQNVKNDSGNYNKKGENVGTNFGISAGLLSKYRGKPVNKKDMSDLTKDEAISIMEGEFKRYHADEVPEGIQKNYFDMAIHSGSNSIKSLQGILGVEADGKFGPKTREALRQRNEESPISNNEYSNARIKHYNNVLDNKEKEHVGYKEKWGSNWINRAKGYMNKEELKKVEEAPSEIEGWDSSTNTEAMGGQEDPHLNMLQEASQITLDGMGKDFGNKVMESSTLGMIMQPLSRVAMTSGDIDPNYDPRNEPELFKDLTEDLNDEQLGDLIESYTGNRHDFITAASSFKASNKRYKEMDEYTQEHPVLSGVNTVGMILGDAAMLTPVSSIIAAKGVAMAGSNILNMTKLAKTSIYASAELAEQGFQEVVWSKYNRNYEFDPTMFGFSVMAGTGIRNFTHNTQVSKQLRQMLRNESGFINLTTAEGKRAVDVVTANVENAQAVAMIKRLEELKVDTANTLRKGIIEDQERLVRHIDSTKLNLKASKKGTKDAKRYKGRLQKLQRQRKARQLREGKELEMLIDGSHPKLKLDVNGNFKATSIAKEIGVDPLLVNTPERLRLFLGLDTADVAEDFIVEGEKAYVGVMNAQLKEMKNNKRLNMNETMKYVSKKLGDNFVGDAVHNLANTDGAMSRFLFNKGNLVSSDNPHVAAYYNWMAPDGMGRQGASKIRAIESQQKYSDIYGGELMGSFHGVGDELYAHIKKMKVTSGKLASTFHVDDYENVVTNTFRQRLLLGKEGFADITSDKDIVRLADEFASRYNSLNNRIVERMKQVGVQGVDFDSTEDFMHRVWDYKKARGVDVKDLESSIYKGMMSYIEKSNDGKKIDVLLIQEEAKKFAYGIRNADITKIEEVQTNYIKMLEKLAAKSEGEASKVVKNEAERLAFQKAQRELGDLAHRAKIDVNVKIGDTNLALSDLLETNFITTQKRYNSRMSARIASAEHGMKNIDDIQEWIDVAVDKEIKRLADKGVVNPSGKVGHMRESMESDLKSFKNGYMSGIKDMSNPDDNDFLRLIHKWNFARVMQYVGISSIAEFGGTLAEAGVRTTMKEFGSSIGGHLKDLYLINPKQYGRAIDEELITITGVGLEDYAFSSRGVSKGERIFKSGLGNAVEQGVDVLSRTTQGTFGQFETISRRITRNSLTQKWAQHFNKSNKPDDILSAFFGKKGKVTNRVMENTNLGTFNESGEFIFNENYDKLSEAFTKHATYNKHGNVTKLNLDKWDANTANLFGDVLQMQSSHILVNPDATTMALWQSTTIGRILNQFRTFGINAATKVGGYTLGNAASGLRHGDAAELQKAGARIFWGTTLGMLAVTTRENIKTIGDGEGFNSELFDEGMMKAAAIGFSRSSVSMNMPTFMDTIGGTFGIDPIFEKTSSIGRSKNMFNLATTPTGQVISGGISGASEIMQGNVKKGSMKLLKMSPFQRQIILQQIFNYTQKE